MEEIKKNIKFSTWVKVWTVLTLVMLVAAFLYLAQRDDEFLMWVLTGLVVLWDAAMLYYAPMSISVNEKELIVNRMMWPKRIPLAEIESINPTPPTMGERRIIGSGGFVGYWGWFRNNVEGKYFAYYGRSSDCFFVRLRSGRGYMLGCEDSETIVDFIRQRIPQK